jgi:hypothetical protein
LALFQFFGWHYFLAPSSVARERALGSTRLRPAEHRHSWITMGPWPVKSVGTQKRCGVEDTLHQSSGHPHFTSPSLTWPRALSFVAARQNHTPVCNNVDTSCHLLNAGVKVKNGGCVRFFATEKRI